MATLQHRSAFNLRGSLPLGGSAIQQTDSGCDAEVLENIHEQVRQAANDYTWEANRIAIKAKLKYTCPKVGDAVRWDPSINGYNLSYAMFDTNNPTDQEHLVEVVGIVESVTTDCTGDGVDFTDDETETNAVIVLSGQISFDSLPNESALSAGVVYYLWDKGNPQNLAIGNNVVNDTNEPVISKPLFLSTGTHSAVVLTYRPLTGSPTGGKPRSETYDIEVKNIPSGWRVRVKNTSVVSSKHPLVVQLDYDRAIGPRDNLNGNEVYSMFKHIGILHDQVVASTTVDENGMTTLLNEITFDVDINSEFGISGGIAGNAENGVNGVGRLTVSLKSNTTGSMSTSALASLISMQTTPRYIRKPSVKISTKCNDTNALGNITTNDPDIRDLKVTPDGTTQNDIQEGIVYEIELLEAGGNWVYNGDENAKNYIEMSDPLHFEISSSALEKPIRSSIELHHPDKTNGNGAAVEIIPVNDSGKGITKSKVFLKFINADGTDLHKNHWAYSLGVAGRSCDDKICCDTTTHMNIDVERIGLTNPDAPLSDLLETDDSYMNNVGRSRLYTLDPDKIPALTNFASPNTLIASFKNAREGTVLCYSADIQSGSEPRFMAIYFNDAKRTPSLDRTSKAYDPRYICVEIGGQETLQDQVMTLTLKRDTDDQVCVEFIFDGSATGNHYTFEELYAEGKIKSWGSKLDKHNYFGDIAVNVSTDGSFGNDDTTAGSETDEY
jgi:hypothetical protein